MIENEMESIYFLVASSPFLLLKWKMNLYKIIIYLFIYIFTKNKRKIIVQKYQHGIFFHKLLYSQFVSCKTYRLFGY